MSSHFLNFKAFKISPFLDITIVFHLRKQREALLTKIFCYINLIECVNRDVKMHKQFDTGCFAS